MNYDIEVGQPCGTTTEFVSRISDISKKYKNCHFIDRIILDTVEQVAIV